MLITDILTRNAGKYGDKTALIERAPALGIRREMTWKEFENRANAIASALIDYRIEKGDKVILLMMNSLEWLPIYFAILKSGAMAVPLNFRFLSKTILRCAGISEAKILIFGEEFTGRINEIKDALDLTVKKYIFAGPDKKRPDYAVLLDNILEKIPEKAPFVKLSPDDSAALYFTSGTTGKPKAVHLTHANLMFACEVEKRHHNQDHDDNFLCIPPLYHTGAKMHWFGNFMVGAKTVILKGVSPKWILEAISEEKITIVWLLVPWAHDILIAIENGEIKKDDYDLDQWRLMHIGAQPVPPSLIKKWKKIFPTHEYDTNYGLTEASGPGCVHLGISNTHKVGAIGIAGYGWECKIVDEDLNRTDPGVPGELAVKGPGVMKEYFKNPEETARVLKDGWLLTGDIAKTDEDGFIWLVDRKKDVIITGGENIFPVEIEEFFMEHDKIQDIGVIGIAHERLGEIVAAVIKVKPGYVLTKEEVEKFSLGLPRYKRPRKIFFDDVPRNPTGKIEKVKLRKKYGRTLLS